MERLSSEQKQNIERSAKKLTDMDLLMHLEINARAEGAFGETVEILRSEALRRMKKASQSQD